MTATCDLCERPTDGYACTTCAGHARRTLTDIAALTSAARAVAHGQSSRGPAVGGRAGAVRLQLNLTASARLDAVQNELTTLVRHVLEERGGNPPSGDLIAGCAAWLTEHVEWIRHRQEAAETFTAIAGCLRVLRGVVNGPADRRWYGTCQADTDDGTCPADLHGKPDADWITCRTCGTRHDADELRGWLDKLARGYSYTATEIEAAYPQIKAGTIRVWAHRRLIVASGEVDGRPVYPLGAVLDFAASEAKRRAEAQSRRARRVEQGAA